MKNTLLITLLGTAVTLATPSVSFADHGHSFKNGTQKHNHKNRSQWHNKSPRNKHVINHNNHRKPVHTQNATVAKRNNNTTFSITWNTSGPIFTYSNVPQVQHNHHYQKPRRIVKQNHGALIYKRIHKQAKRIQQGIRNGQLVNREARRLQQEQHHIKQMMVQYKRDGRINRYERDKLNQLLNVASNNIYRKSNNHRTRYTQRNQPRSNHNNVNNNYYHHFVQF